MKRAWMLPLLLVGGCYSYGLQRPDTPPVDAFGAVGTEGRICVLRPHWNASAVTAVVYDNDTLVGATRGPTYFCYATEPGRHVITSKADSVEQATLDVEPGKRYFLHQIVDNIFGVVRTRLAWVDEGEAARLIGDCGYGMLVSVPASERLPTGAPVPAAATL
jgi:hypothetical protein